MEPQWIILGMIALAIVIRLFAGGMDGDRVREYIEGQGGRLLSSEWSPFGRGWFGDKNDRIYEVRYVDRDGNEHMATCKTSMFSGVYFTEDHIVRRKPGSVAEPAARSAIADLELENRRLKEELKRLKGRDA